MSDSLKESICVYKHLEEAAKTRYGQNGEYGWMYIGTTDGHFRRFPGTARRRGLEDGEEHLRGCLLYDPRTRPWYIAASTGPKDIVILIDKSGSMNDVIGLDDRTKWNVTQKAVSDMLDTFTVADFLNVVTFSNESYPLGADNGLNRGEAKNLENLKEAMSNEFPGDEGTNYIEAFAAAFRLLSKDCNDEPKPCSGCQKIILFLTDGQAVKQRTKPSQILAEIEDLQQELENQTQSRASIFTYSISEQADDSIPRQIACANDGAWSLIKPGTNTLDALNSYYLFIAAGRRTTHPVWVEPYPDASDLGLVTSVSIPFYGRAGTNTQGVFLGVAGHPIFFRELREHGVSESVTLNALIDRSERCGLVSREICDLQVYRHAHDERSLCPDPYPPSTLVDALPLCYEHNENFYKRLSEEVTWNQAVVRCRDDGQLVSIRDTEELAFLANLASADGSWVGANRTSTTQFGWVDTEIPVLENESDFWGVGEPLTSGQRTCVAIDRRGITGNLHANACNDHLSYMCVYQSNTSCAGGVTRIPDEGYFKVPPLHECIDAAENLNQARPIPAATDLSLDDVMCELGEGMLTNETVLCCPHKNSAVPLLCPLFLTFVVSLFLFHFIAIIE